MKLYKKIVDWAMILVAIIIGIGVGGLFLQGTFLNVIVLKLLPKIVHDIVGWAVIALTVIAGFSAIKKKL